MVYSEIANMMVLLLTLLAGGVVASLRWWMKLEAARLDDGCQLKVWRGGAPLELTETGFNFENAVLWQPGALPLVWIHCPALFVYGPEISYPIVWNKGT